MGGGGVCGEASGRIISGRTPKGTFNSSQGQKVVCVKGKRGLQKKIFIESKKDCEKEGGVIIGCG